MVAIRMDVGAVRRVPFTQERALTEVAQSRRYLDAAARSLELAAEILESRGGADAVALRQILARLREAEAELASGAAELGR